jgi:uncharacterized membrane protein YdjX (TVP38/TMEM64 family)
MDKKEKSIPIIKLAILIIISIIIIVISIIYTPVIIKLISNTEKFKDYILSFGSTGIFIYMCFQILHVIIIIIPGELIQIAGGYIYGVVPGTMYALLGMTLGIIIVFFTTRILGYSVIEFFVQKEKIDKFNFLINSPKSEIIMFILFLIPGFPKDALVYIAGLTPIKPLRFFFLCSVARFPGIVGSAYIGAKLGSKNYVPVIIVSIVAIVLFIFGVIFQEKIVNSIHAYRNKNKNLIKE